MEEAHGSRKEGVQAIPTIDDLEQGNPVVLAKFKVIKKTDIPEKKNEISKRGLFSTIVCTIFMLVIVYLFFKDVSSVDDTHYPKSKVYNENYNDNSLSASIYGSSWKEMRKCSYYKNGCCHIYHSCTIFGENLDYEKIEISPHKILANDTKESNCPSLWNILLDYNHNHPIDEECSKSKYGCCRINHSCDSAIHFKKMFSVSVNETIRNLKRDKQGNIRTLDLNIQKKDEMGSNCPSIGNILYEYEKRETHGGKIMYVILGFVCLSFTISLLRECCKRRNM